MPSARKSAPPKPKAPSKRTAVPHGPSEGKGKPAASKQGTTVKTAPAKKSTATRTARGGAAASKPFVVTLHVMNRLLAMKLAALRRVGRLVIPASGIGLQGNELSALLYLTVLASTDVTPLQKASALFGLDMIDPTLRSKLPADMLGAALERDAPEVRAWRAAVLKRDGRACTRCNSTRALHAHHINRWSDAPHLRIAVDNGVTLCQPCHVEEHRQAA